MEVTILGSGDPLGMPVPMCSCRYCEKSSDRLRAGLKIESDSKTIVLDAGPDIRYQLIETETKKVDGFFVTHRHFDHFGGLPELGTIDNFTESEINLYGSPDLEKHIDNNNGWINLEVEISKKVELGNLTIEAFEVDHSDNFPTRGYSVTNSEGKKIVYIPDLKKLRNTDQYRNADILFIDGMYLFKKHFENDEDHASKEKLEQEIESCEAQKVVLLGISEHFNQMTEEEMKEKTKYKIGEDFKQFTP